MTRKTYIKGTHLPTALTLFALFALLSPQPSAVSAPDPPWSWIDGNIPSYGQEPIRRNMSIRLGAYMYVFDNLTEKELLRFAGTHFDIFSYNHIHFDHSSTKELREHNPAICLLLTFCPLILDESNASLLNVGGWSNASMASWVLRTADGREAPNTLWSFANTHFMNIGNSDWATYFRDRANMWVDLMGADGYFIDGVPWNGVYYPDPGTLPEYNSTGQIDQAIIRFLDIIRTPHHCLVLDDVTEPWQQAHLDGVWGEDWLGYDSTVPWGSTDVKRWREAVENLERYSAQRKPYIAQAWYHYGRTKELEYLAATYLLGKKSNSATFQPCPVGSPALSRSASYDYSSYEAAIYELELREHPGLFSVDLGGPQGGRAEIEEDFWVRAYSKGLVFVNPSSTRARAFQLDAPMKDVNGSWVTRVELAPRSAAILTGPDPVSRGLAPVVRSRLVDLNGTIEEIGVLGGNTTDYRALLEGLSATDLTKTNITAFFDQVGELSQSLERGRAEALLGEAERVVSLAKNQGIDTKRYELFLERARQSLQEGNYASVEAMCQYPLTLKDRIRQRPGIAALLLLLALLVMKASSREGHSFWPMPSSPGSPVRSISPISGLPGKGSRVHWGSATPFAPSKPEAPSPRRHP